MSTPWKTFEHRNYNEALDLTYNTAVNAKPGDSILIVGPTGVGKSAILEAVLDMLVGPPHTWPNGELHYIKVACDRDAPGAITRNIAVDLNRQFGNPFVELHLPLRDQNHPFGPVRAQLNEHDLRESFRVLGAQLRTRYVGIDAMENIVPRQEIASEARFNSIKSLVNPHKKHARAHEMTLIMAGHYSLLRYWRANAQLSRRITEINVLPYRRTQQDILCFEKILHLASPLFPLKSGRSLRDWNELLYELSAGCIGMLYKLLNDAISHMRSRKGSELKLDDVGAAAPAMDKLENVKHDLDGFWPYVGTSATPELMARARARERAADGDLTLTKAAGLRRRVGRKVGSRDTVG